eukprot:SM000714S21264  [mRNA]  locus=s714:1696:2096:+ [translate_table: standard]
MADNVTADCFDSRSSQRSAEEAGHAVRQAAGAKESEFVALAVNVHRALGTRRLDLLRRLARRAVSRRQGQQIEQPGLDATMRLAVSLQRSLALAVRLRRAAPWRLPPSGFRQGDEFAP